MVFETGLGRLLGERRSSPIASAEMRCRLRSEELLLDVVDWDQRLRLPSPSFMSSFMWLVVGNVLAAWPEIVGVSVPGLGGIGIVSGAISVSLSPEAWERPEALLAAGKTSGETVRDGRFW